MNTHQCIKSGCANMYQDSDPDAYYCPSCVVEKNALAKRLDKKFNTSGQQPSGELSAYDAARNYIDPKTGEQKVAAFPSAASLGMKI